MNAKNQQLHDSNQAIADKSKDWFIYLLETRTTSLYCGITNNLERRMRQHRGELKGGAKALRGKTPLTLMALWQTDGKSNALKFEYWLKQLSASQKRTLIDKALDLTGHIDSVLPESLVASVQRIQTPKWLSLN